MIKRFKRGLVVGKFSPLHRGHELVIHRAIECCEEVVLLSYSKPEFPGCEAVHRERWLSRLFPNTLRLVVTDQRLHNWARKDADPQEIPDNDADALSHRRFCGYLCRHVLGVTVDAVFTSEDYGEGFAEELTRFFRETDASFPSIMHVLVDRDRVRLPVSGTLIRGDVHTHRAHLAPEVYSTFVNRVCLLGGESTGKSTLAEMLARAFSTVHVAEYGRELWETKSGMLKFEDMRHIAEVQVQREDAAVLKANNFLFCDTSPLTTLFYSHHLFGKAETGLERLAERSYHFTVLCAPDFAFVQDGTRQQESFRELQQEWYVNELRKRHIGFVSVDGPVENRIRQVRELLGAQL